MANPVNITRLLELAARQDIVRKAGLLPVVIPEDIMQSEVLNPNYIPPNYPTRLLIITYVCVFVPLVGVILRFLARFGTETPLGLDDWFSAVAWLTSAAYGATSILAVKMGGIGRHIWLLSDQELSSGYMIGYFHQIFYGVASFFLHVAIMFFYLRIIPKELFTRKILYGFFVFHIVYLIAFLTVSAVQCIPFRSGYDLTYRLTVGEGNKCQDPTREVTVLTIIGAVTDLMLFFLPLSVVWRLGLKVRQKIMVSGLFLIGALACVTSSIRLHYLFIFYKSFDRSFTSMVVNALGHIEIALGLFAACLPMMRQAVLLIPQPSLYSKIFSIFRRKRRRQRPDGIRIQKIDSRSTKLTTADEGTVLQELSTIGGGGAPSSRRQSVSQMGRPRRNTTGSVKQSRMIRDISREMLVQAATTSDAPPDMDTMWIMMDEGPVRIPIRLDDRDRGVEGMV
ncbi:hypothetical protein TWF694_002848 [Orbilia ellipsospora]|uniref:Rhodopsin domain-containing protein n=1 Tax=Orbilia ellipsospora TaxID=2528407 RepID=A0AAV9X2F7_9PEZI